ncbi:MAG: GAF domain-containing protein [Omnitrophica WOR_2 bacterium]
MPGNLFFRNGRRFQPDVVLIYQVIALFIFAAVPFLASGWQTSAEAPISLPSSYYILYLVGLFYLLSSLWVYYNRSQDKTAGFFCIFSTSSAITIVLLSNNLAAPYIPYLWIAGLSLAGGSLISLALVFPEPVSWIKNHPFWSGSGYIFALLVYLYAAFGKGVGEITPLPASYLAGIAFFCFIARQASAYIRTISPVAREQSRLVLLGSVASFLPLVLWTLLSSNQPGLSTASFLLLFLVAFPIATGYSILHDRLFQTNYLANRLILYGVLSAIAAVAYALIVSGVSIVLEATFLSSQPFAFGAIIFLLALVFLPLRNQVQRKINERFSRGQTVYRERLQAFSRELTQAVTIDEITRLLRRSINQSVDPARLHIFIFDELSDHFLPSPGEDDAPTTDLRFSSKSPLVKTLESRRSALLLSERRTLPLALQQESARLALLRVSIFIPLPGKNRLAGWLGIGPRRTGASYPESELNFLESLADQAALAVERAQVMSNLERHIHQMNILTRVSQGINITKAFDDILELIYAQTSQLIPTRDFRITLRDAFSDILYHVFFLENDERIIENENKPLPLGQGLEYEVINGHRPLVTGDYEQECRSRGVLPTTPGIVAWMGVPLNAGSETIGAITLGSRDPSVTYPADQVNMVQAIADQAAGAIVKARLLEESQRRTRQLTTLNEVARSLTSTLELDHLLDQILQSAVEILNCVAGSLVLVDEQTDELVFEVAAGPVASAFTGKRLPAGTGLVGKAVETRSPIIANDVRRNKEWFEQPDQQSGFVTQDILVVPMMFKERVTGVIEVINRKDGLPFMLGDQELLEAYTSQAAIAIENARLYTLTDQALAARVEELSVMQRIDRELNASLDIHKTMRITLYWAMRQSKADAGLVGVVEEGGVKLMASHGYIQELEPYQNSYLPEGIPAIQAAIENGKPQILHDNHTNNAHGCLLASASCQLSVPILMESKVIGVILLESRQDGRYPGEMLEFLSRLSDHATIAIANAQLYTEIEAANLAKSEFVSFVSHELKTPMTSIKGFTDLLASGVVGPVNEAQANFLGTIRSNVDRMATLVSDLADVSRIESGKLRLDYTSVPVSDIVDDVLKCFKAQVEARKLVLIRQVPEIIPPMWGDRVRLTQILTNLVSNAFKYSMEGGEITVCVEPAMNQWDPGGSPRVIHTTVRDTGFGISPEDQAKIFQKFFRSEDQEVRNAPGTGLGLNITKQLVEMQGGKIWFVSELRKGSEFHFIIPIAETP